MNIKHSEQWSEISDQWSVVSGQRKNKNSPLITHHSQLTTHNSQLTTHHSPLTTHHSSLITRHSSLTTGFSFMELMVVVAIMAVLVAASMPAFRNYTRGRNLKEGTNMVISALRKTRNTAITDRKKYRTVFDTVNNAVAIYLSGDDVNPAENWKGLSEFVEFNETNLPHFPPSPSTPSDDLYYAEFKPNGAANVGGSIILLETSTSDTKKIIFNNITGRIRVE